MKKVTCAICGKITSEFIRHNLIPYCYSCFFSRFNYCSKCGKALPYKSLYELETQDGIEYYCFECLDWVFKCSFCGRPIGKHENVYIDDNLDIFCPDCRLYLNGDEDDLD